ncbi:MAG: hypothetical protein KA761_02945 [Gemmatimonadaceae bacterium]|jgi:hypothetical protein|nr:hypothetical protein [Gemmatimonadaceae bacterium]
MIAWILALAGGYALAALGYGARPADSARLVFALRFVAGAIAAALLLDAPLAPARPLAPWVGVDASASWNLGQGGWDAARRSVDSLRSAGADSVLLFGDSVRTDSLPTVPADRASRVEALVEAAMATGRPLVLVTDGRIDDPERVAKLPRGSAVIVIPGTTAADAAIAVLDAPGGALGGDTIPVRIVAKAGTDGSAAASVELRLDDRVISTSPLPALGAFEEREFRVSIPVPAADATRRIAARIVQATPDAVATNDTASAPLVVSGAAAATFISTSPDQDARFALAVLRGTRRGPVQAFWRVTRDQWRTDGAMRPVTEAAVRAAAASAPLLVLHGDTAVFGAPRALGRGATVLIAPPATGDDYYPAGTGDSPLAAALAGVPWDSLPPLDVAAMAPRGYPAVIARRARRFDERTVFHLEDGARRTVTVPASGLWRWRLRGGRTADAFDAVWGSVFDWVGDDRGAAMRAAEGIAPSRTVLRAEWVPRRATVVSGAVGEGTPMDRAPRALLAWWLAAIAITALCAEWLLRRKIGLR